MIVQGVEVCYTPVSVDVHPMDMLVAIKNGFFKECGLNGSCWHGKAFNDYIKSSLEIESGQWVFVHDVCGFAHKAPLRAATEEEVRILEALKVIETFLASSYSE